MDRGFYAAAGAANLVTHLQESVAHNLANVNTTAYKRRIGAVHNFDLALQDAVGGKPELALRTDYSQGDLYRTEDPFHVALEGDGFLVVEDGAGSVLYSRDGRLHLDPNGNLALGPRPLVGAANITAPGTATPGEFVIHHDGRIAIGDKTVGRLRVVSFDDVQALHPLGAGLFEAPVDLEAKPSQAAVRQGYLERSNVSVVDSLVEMISLARTFDSANRALKSVDEIMRRRTDPRG